MFFHANRSLLQAQATARLTNLSRHFSMPDVLHRKVYGGRIFTLNRPKSMNALNISMVRNIYPQLQAWSKSDQCKVVIIKAETAPPEKKTAAFCAGGDVVSLLKNVQAQKTAQSLDFFREEYTLNHLIATIQKPYVAFLDGVTMGGGVGISIHAPFRIATERTLFAMPETNIGFFPDVGGSFFLPRLDGAMGKFLALTGARLRGADAVYAGIATHFVPSARIPALEARLCELESDDREVVSAAIEEFSETLPSTYNLGGLVRERIDRCFGRSTIPAIVEALEKEGDEWSEDVRATLLSMSPLSLKVTLEQLRRGAKLSFADCMKMEFGVAQRMILQADFQEGVEKTLVEKSRAAKSWTPPTLEEISDSWVVQEFFENPKAKSLTLPSHTNDPGAWHSYPYAYPNGRCNMPNEAEVRDLIQGTSRRSGPTSWSKEEFLDFIVAERDGRKGARVVVEEILKRKAVLGAGGYLGWMN
ncbi:ClpP/crotonase-like domain-containing protein [Piptocephalis cylindrospora]|uniref:3-hydroxyisobutyryl-CoA hydrolase n=1 Tax=Piptocephalis cylindrospora TaxID=1907219 RepID=A0A4P9Y7N8_9FUNG|nr:ClpP/crotonase-like domain-containing protein [Piptocephalis cylindrospora]|eukprot:RKP13940.1 ClpP/crotonase-like domain-containing protein [Piptocephalis cylindrospora]